MKRACAAELPTAVLELNMAELHHLRLALTEKEMPFHVAIYD